VIPKTLLSDFLKRGSLGAFALSLTACLEPNLSSMTAAQVTEFASAVTASPTPTVVQQNNALLLRADKTTTTPGGVFNLTVSGGTSPYYFSVQSGSGTITPFGSKASYNTPAQADTAQIQVRDAVGNQDQISLYTVTTSSGNQQTSTSSVTPNDPMFSQLFGLSRIDVLNAWTKVKDCSPVLVGILDSGMDNNHPDLRNNIYINPNESGVNSSNSIDDDKNGFVDDYYGWNFVASGVGSNNTMDDFYHGTHVSGIIAAQGNNLQGITGVCWKASLIPIKILDQTGKGTSSDLIDGIDYAISIHARILNASVGGYGSASTIAAAISRANDAGIVFVAAAGNGDSVKHIGMNNDVTPNIPSSFPASVTTPPNIIAVAAIDPRPGSTMDSLTSFSNYGVSSVHIAAPGLSILSTTPTTQSSAMKTEQILTAYDTLQGTSMATPFVTGVAALILSQNPGMTALQVKSRILDRADSLPSLDGKIQLKRRLNAKSAVSDQ
jgi:subtilisin family serine protease